MESYKVSYTITGKSYDPADNGKEMTLTFDVTVEFSYDPDTYGNGYSMGISGKGEPFGFTGYDIRYDRDFDPANKMAYVMQFYATKYSGAYGSWKLKELSIKEET